MKLDEYKKNIGFGHKTNLWDISFLFSKTNTSLYNKVKTDIDNYNKSTVFNDVNNQKFFNDTSKTFNCLVRKFQLPSYGVNESVEVARFKKYASGTPSRGNVGNIEVIQDQWNVNYMFWKLFITYINDGMFMTFPEDYMFDIEFKILYPELYNNERYYYQKWKFYNCFPTTISDINYERKELTALNAFTLTMYFEDYDYENISTKDVDIEVEKPSQKVQEANQVNSKDKKTTETYEEKMLKAYYDSVAAELDKPPPSPISQEKEYNGEG